MTAQERQVAYLESLGWRELGDPRRGYRSFGKKREDGIDEGVCVGPRGGVHSDGCAYDPSYTSRWRPELRAPEGWTPE